jgi:DNA invertase Pin-like site-specific DNA recombinase
MDGRFVSYLRVSTGKQGLGIEAQRATVENYLNGGNWRVSAESPLDRRAYRSGLFADDSPIHRR